MIARPLESQLLRSSVTLLVWISGIVATLSVAVLLSLLMNDQTPERNRALLEEIAEDAHEVREMLIAANPRQLRIMLHWLSEYDVDQGYEWNITDQQQITLLPNSQRRLADIELVQWIEGGQRFSNDGAELGALPMHWKLALGQSETAILSEPLGSAILQGPLRVFGAETLLIKVDASRALAIVIPTRLFSNRELWGYSLLWTLLLWAGLLCAFGILAFPIMYLLARRQARKIAAPLARLSLAAEALARGERHQRVSADGSLETLSLASSFNQMAESWATAREKEQEALSRLEHAIRTQQQFVSDISHDLRTPLTAMLGYTERAQRRLADDPDLRVIASEGEALKILVNNLFEIAQGELDATRLCLRRIQIHALLLRLVSAFGPQAWAKGVLIRCAPESQDFSAELDPDRIGLALRNLVDNAVQHTREGGLVELAAQQCDHHFELTVTDTGEGIDRDLLPRVFERGVRGDEARTRRGGGLGLAIVKQIAQQHGGEVSVTSQSGHGTRFCLRLPKAASAPKK